MRRDGVAVGRYLAFKKRAFAMSNAAAFDDDQRSARIAEWERDMQLFWLSAQKTIDPDRAEEAALASVGNLAKACSLREPLWYRLAFYKRLQTIRLLLIAFAGVSMGGLRSIRRVSITLHYGLPRLDINMDYRFDYYIFIGGICATLAYCSRLPFARSNPITRLFLSSFALLLNMHIVMLFSIGLYGVTTSHEWIESPHIILPVLLTFVILLLSQLCLIAELLDLPSQKPKRGETSVGESEPDVFEKIAKPFVWIARRLL